MSDAVSDQAARIAVLEEIARGTRAALERIERRMDGFDGRLAAMDGRLAAIDARLDTRLGAMDGRIDRLSQRLDRFFLWMLGLMLAGFTGLLGTMAHGFGWL